MIADDVLELGQDLEEVVVAHLRVSAYVLQAVDYLGLQFDQGLDGDLVDLLESLSIKILEVFGFKFLNKFRVGPLKICFSDSAILIKSKMFLSELFMQKFLKLFFADMSFIK